MGVRDAPGRRACQVGSLASDSPRKAAASISAGEAYSPIGSGTSTIAATTTASRVSPALMPMARW